VRSYETIVVLDAELEEEPIEQEVNAIEQIITSHSSGEMVDTERWGNRKLSYEMNDKRQGYYTLFRFNSEPDVLDELTRAFKLNENVLRHIIKRVKQHQVANQIEADKQKTEGKES